MIGGCFIGAYPFQADLMSKKRINDVNTGQIKYIWQLWKVIDCSIAPFTSTSFKAQGSNETFGQMYENIGYLKMKTRINPGRNVQVTNIRNKATQIPVYVEMELKNAPPTWYNSQGSSPLLDPFGRIIQYDTLLVRAEVQGDKS